MGQFCFHFIINKFLNTKYMAISQPQATDYLNAPDHSTMHRIIGLDLGATEKIFQIDASDNICMGDATPTNYIKIAAGGVLTFEGTAAMGGNLVMGANNITMTGSLSDTTNRVLKGWFTGLEVTNLTIANDNFIESIDNAGTGAVDMFKVNTSDEIEVGAVMEVGPIELEEDSGAVTVINLPVSATPADGTEESMSFAIDSNEVLKIYGEADSAGGADTFKVLTTGQITSSYTGSAGWSVIANTTPDTTTCIESCTFACLFGWDDTGATILDCSSTVPDKCVCMGAS